MDFELSNEDIDSFFSDSQTCRYLLSKFRNVHHDCPYMHMVSPCIIDYPFSQEDLDNLLFGLASRFFGIRSLYEYQSKAAKAALVGKDAIVVQPTGRGKSICYQLVALQAKKIAFVFTPTLALMYDQV